NLLPTRTQQRVVRGVLDQRMLKNVGGIWWSPAAKNDLRLTQYIQGFLKRCSLPRGNRLDQAMRELSPDRRADLRYLFCAVQPVEACHKRVLKGGWNGQWRKWTAEHIRTLAFDKQSRLKNVFRNLFQKERNAIRFHDDLIDDFDWKGVAAGNV